MIFFSFKVFAHPLDVGFITIEEQQSELAVKLELNPKVGCQILQILEECSDLTYNDLFKKRAADFFNASLGLSSIQINNEECRWQDEAKLELESATILSLKVKAVCNSLKGHLLWSFPFLLKLDSTFSLIAKVHIFNQERILGIDSKQTSLNLVIEDSSSDMSHFIKLGLEHIGIAKSEWVGSEGFHLPAGIDHILFVVALILASLNLFGVMKTVTGFTLGHSVTLTLGGFQLIHVPPQLTEIAIAISIAIVAAESLWLKKYRSQWRLAFVFGLIHGLGFASAIQDLHLQSLNLVKALFGFNLGVEIGQITLILIIYPFTRFVSRFSFGNRLVIPGMALLIFCLGIYWTFQRVFFF